MEYLLYYLLVFICVFQNNFFLARKIGLIGNTFIPIVVPLIFMFILIKNKKLKISKVTKVLIKLYIYVIFINIFILFIYLNIYNGISTILNENVFTKALKGMVYLPLIICFIIAIENLSHKLTQKRLLRPFFTTFVFLFLSLLFELTNSDLFNSIFHDGEFYNRIRLYTNESSFTGSIIVVYGFMSVYYACNYKKSLLPIIFIMLVIFVLTSGSKGFIFVSMISIVLMLLLSNVKVTYKLFILLISLVIGSLVLNPIIMSLKNDIHNYTSVSTRLYTVVISLIMIIKYPLGVGNSLYIKFFPEELALNMSYINNTQLNLSEINSYIFATNDKNIGVKSGILQWGILWGIPGIVLLSVYFIKVRQCILDINNKYKNILVYIFLYIILASLSYISLEIKYEVWLFMASCVSIANSQENNKIHYSRGDFCNESINSK